MADEIPILNSRASQDDDAVANKKRKKSEYDKRYRATLSAERKARRYEAERTRRKLRKRWKDPHVRAKNREWDNRKRANLSPEQLIEKRHKEAAYAKSRRDTTRRAAAAAEISWRAAYPELAAAADEQALVERTINDAMQVERRRQRARERRIENPGKARARDLKAAEKSRDRRRIYGREWRRKNPAKSVALAIAYEKRRTHADPVYRLRKLLRNRIRGALKLHRTERVGSAVRDLGCSVSELKIYIENLWAPGMSWENYGPSGWVIDHIKPLASFNLSNREQFLAACHYTNLQPLWWLENLIKGAKIETPSEEGALNEAAD